MSDIFTAFGLQRSGTNFTEELITTNFCDAEIVNCWRGRKTGNGIWKHAYDVEYKSPKERVNGLKGDKEKAEMIGREINSIYIHKHPYSWIQSLLRKKVDIKSTYPSVIQDLDSEENVVNGLNIVHMAQLYHDHTQYWLNKVETRKVYHIKYEDLISSTKRTKEIVLDMAKFFNKKLKNDEIEIPTRVTASGKFNEDKRIQYKTYQIKTLTFEQIQKINSILSPALLARQGYDLIETEQDYRAHKV